MTERRDKIVQIIEKTPGLNFRDLMRTTGMKNGVLSHHLNKLEKRGSILAVRGPRQSRFYPLGLSETEQKMIKALRRHTPKLILESLVLHDGLDFQGVVRFVKRSPSTVSLYLSQLVRDGLVKPTRLEQTKTYHLVDKQILEKLVDYYQPGPLDKPVSGLEEMFNSL